MNKGEDIASRFEFVLGGRPAYALTNSPPMEGCPEGGVVAFPTCEVNHPRNHPVRLRLPPLQRGEFLKALC